ncbi:unnamed protein product, partial [Bemisia tabaci]
MNIFLQIFQLILFAISPGVPEYLRTKYSYISSKMSVLSMEIWQLSNVHTTFFLSTAVLGRDRGVACFAIYRLLCHLNLWKRIDKQGVRREHLNNRFFTTGISGIIIDV